MDAHPMRGAEGRVVVCVCWTVEPGSSRRETAVDACPMRGADGQVVVCVCWVSELGSQREYL